jgi:pimeloyl-ACP methyl ester carboxylesterase
MQVITTTTKDKLILNGLLFEPPTKSDTIIINIHGMSGDPYRNSFYPSMFSTYPKNNIAFLSSENRGMQNITQFNNAEGDVLNIGNTFELFEDCVFDIEAWVEKAVQLGYTKIWLQGHSLGPSKIVYYLTNTKQEHVAGLIFLSPSEMVGLVHDEIGKRDHEVLQPEALELVKNGKPDQILSNAL